MAVITKLLEGTLAVGQTSISFTDSDIPNSFIRVGCTNDDLFPSDMRISSNTLTITYDAQSSALGVIVELVKDDLSVIDNLTSESQTDALSANQGSVLKGLIDNITSITELNGLDDVSITDPAAGDILTYDSVNETWDNIPMPSIPYELDDLSDVDLTSPTSGEGLVFNGSEWSNGNISSEETYTETEGKIGSYLGSDLYQKVIKIAGPVNLGSSYTITHGLTGIDKIITCFGSYIQVNNSRRMVLPNTRANYTEDVFINAFVDTTTHIPSISLATHGYSYGQISDIEIIVKYTKV